MCALSMEIKMAGWEVINCYAARLPTIQQLANMHGRINDIGMEPMNRKIDKK